MYIKQTIILLSFNLLSLGLSGQNKNSTFDTILNLRENSKNQSFNLKKRLDYARKASELSIKYGVDSTILRSNRNLAIRLLDLENYDEYLKINQNNLSLATKLKDTSGLAAASYNLGSYYGVFQPLDSSFYHYEKALKYFNVLGDNYFKAIILVGIAYIQESQKDYLAAEENLIKAITLFQTMPKNEEIRYQIHLSYDTLASISLMIGELDKSIEYHDRAMEVAKEMDESDYYSMITNHNKAFTLRRQGKFEESLKLYQEVLNYPNLFNDEPEFYALVLDNIAFTKFKRGDDNYEEIERELLRAYSISDSIGNKQTMLGVTIDLSKVMEANKKIDSSRIFAEKSLKLAEELDDNEIYLDALLMLSKTTSGEKGKEYLLRHINLSDSLLNLERSARNKFARIKFDTDQIEQENERINRQKQWLIGISAGLLLTSFLIYIIITQRARNKELQFQQDQQKANEEIYNLMLSQQDKVDEARTNEKKRISQEIHDGVLGRMFGVRLSLDSLNFNNGPDAIKDRAQYINELKTIEEDMRKISHELNTDFVSGSGFVDILEELIEKQAQAYGIDYSFTHADDINWESISNKTKINLYRIIQETLQNIYKHAEANKVWISLLLKKNVIYLGIRDDGKGFDISKSKKGIGLKNINSRIDEIDGNLDLRSIINEGTSVEIEVPYKV